MLLSFTFENIFCFDDETRLSMVATPDKLLTDHVVKIDRPGAVEALRAAAIYGGNGHGKTRLVEAMSIFKDIAVDIDGPGALRRARPFVANKGSNKPTKLVMNFRTGGCDYEYGIAFNSKRILQEWLYETEKRQEVMLFTREFIADRKKDRYDISFGAKLRNSNSPSRRFKMSDYLMFAGTATDDTKSLLSELFEKGVSRLKLSHDWIAYTLQIVNADSHYSDLHEKASSDQDFIKFLSDNLKDSDTGINQISLDEKKFNYDKFQEDAPESLHGLRAELSAMEGDGDVTISGVDGVWGVISKKGEDYNFKQISAIHKCDGEEYKFELSDESSGTRRMVDLLPMVYSAKNKESVFVVDELDRKLHPVLSYNFIKSMLSASIGQIIFTTHTTHLLDLDLLRRDEIWFVEKDKNGRSSLQSLAEFSVRNDLDIRRGYLHGRFGALPFNSNKLWLNNHGDS